jgi:hypothetical protein
MAEMHSELLPRYRELAIKVNAVGVALKNERARDFMIHGIGRRLWILYRSVENIFRLFPPDRIQPLLANDRIDVEINLHAFLINAYGIIENIALSLGFENDLIGKKDEGKVPLKEANLFNGQFQKHLSDELRAYLANSTVSDWYREYAKNYRDALAHRIPPYVPPSALDAAARSRFEEIEQEIGSLYATGVFDRIEALRDEQEGLGRANPLYLHSFSEKSRPLYLHQQMIMDFLTIEELVKMSIGNSRGDGWRRPLTHPGT